MDCLDKNRRSMSQALRTAELGEEALAFVAGQTRRPQAEAVEGAAEKLHTEDLARPSEPGSNAPAPPQIGVPNPKPADVPPDVGGIVSITVRLPASLPPRLLRASVERKLQRKQPFTQQDIVAAALEHWLTQNGEAD